MRDNPDYRLEDVDSLRRLVRAHPFVTIVSSTAAGLVASHYPVLVDDSVEHLQLLGHVGRPDERVHELGEHEVLVIVQGEHGYISSSWYDRSVPSVPTWNFVVAHLSGVPEILEPAENLAVLGRMVDAMEDRVPHPRPMAGTEGDAVYAARISAGTVGFRLPISRIVAKNKLSQDKPATTVDHVIRELEAPGPYRNADLAGLMREERSS